MKLIKENVLALLITALSTTLIWIFLFRAILSTLYNNFPPVMSKTFYLDLVSPKPFDIPVYLILTLIFVLVLWFISRQKWQIHTPLPLVLPTIGIALMLIFIIFLGGYPMATDFSIANPWWLSYITGIGLIIVAGITLYRILHSKQWVYFLIITIIIAIITFQPGFIVSWFDYTYLIGPASEVLQGKTIFLQAPSQYGFVLVYALALLMKFSISAIFMLPVIIWVLYTAAYASLFFIMIKLTRSEKISIFFLATLITINYYSILIYPIAVPQVTPLRFLCLWFAPIIFYLTYFTKRIKYVGFLIMAFLSLWVIDVGIQYLLAMVSFECLLFLKRLQSLRQTVLHVGFVAISVIFIFLLFSAGSTLLGYTFLTPLPIFHAIREYAVIGFGMIPLPDQTFFWLFILIFFCSIIFFFMKDVIEKADVTLMFTSFLFFFASMYYIGRSHPHNIFHIAVLFLFTLFLLVSRIQRTYHIQTSKKANMIIGILAFFLCVVFTSAMRQSALETILSNYASSTRLHAFLPSFGDFFKQKFQEDTNFIKKNNPDRHAVVISPENTILLLLSQKSSSLLANPMSLIISDADLAFAFSQMTSCPTTIFVARCLAKGTDCTEEHWVTQFVAEDKVYKKMQRMCSNRYTTSHCTDSLCMMHLK